MADDPLVWVTGAKERLEAEIARQRLSEWSVSQSPLGDLRKALAAVERVLALHSEFRVYEPCEHEHTEEDVREGRAVGAWDFISCQDCYVFSVCRECCTGGASQFYVCASDHDAGKCWPCPTVAAITGEVLTEEAVDDRP